MIAAPRFGVIGDDVAIAASYCRFPRRSIAAVVAHDEIRSAVRIRSGVFASGIINAADRGLLSGDVLELAEFLADGRLDGSDFGGGDNPFGLAPLLIDVDATQPERVPSPVKSKDNSRWCRIESR